MNPATCKKLIIIHTFVTIMFTYWQINKISSSNSNSSTNCELPVPLTTKSVNYKDMCYEQDDLRLVEFVRKTYVVPPNDAHRYISKSVALTKTSSTLKETLIELFANKEQGWTGLLVEPAKKPFKKLQSMNRKAWISNVAVSSTPHPNKANFFENALMDPWGGLLYRFYKKTEKKSSVQCIPLFTLILAMNTTIVDLLILDVEGTELNILRTIPFDKLSIGVVSVEVNSCKEGRKPIEDLMQKNGYVLIKQIIAPLRRAELVLISSIITKTLVQSVHLVFTKKIS